MCRTRAGNRITAKFCSQYTSPFPFPFFLSLFSSFLLFLLFLSPPSLSFRARVHPPYVTIDHPVAPTPILPHALILTHTALHHRHDPHLIIYDTVHASLHAKHPYDSERATCRKKVVRI